MGSPSKRNLSAAEALQDHIDGGLQTLSRVNATNINNVNRLLFVNVVEENNRLRVENERYKSWIESKCEFILQLEKDLMDRDKKILDYERTIASLENKVERMGRRVVNTEGVGNSRHVKMPVSLPLNITTMTTTPNLLASGSTSKSTSPTNIKDEQRKKKNKMKSLHKQVCSSLERKQSRKRQLSETDKEKKVRPQQRFSLFREVKNEAVTNEMTEEHGLKADKDVTATPLSASREDSSDQTQKELTNIYKEMYSDLRMSKKTVNSNLLLPHTSSLEHHKSCTTEPKASSSTVLSVPEFRLNPLPTIYSMEGTEHIGEGYEVIERRHKKYEDDEKKRKRWDLQRQRELARERQEKHDLETSHDGEKTVENVMADPYNIEIMVLAEEVPLTPWNAIFRKVEVPKQPVFFGNKTELNRIRELRRRRQNKVLQQPNVESCKKRQK